MLRKGPCYVTICISHVAIASMSQVHFKKSWCRHVEFMGQGHQHACLKRRSHKGICNMRSTDISLKGNLKALPVRVLTLYLLGSVLDHVET